MSAVSSGSAQGNAEVREPEGSHQSGSPQSGSAQSGSAQSGSAQQPADFGANEWLVEELYQRYLADPGSVDRAWWSFFADYQPALANGTGPQPVISVARAAASAAPAAPRPGSPRSPAAAGSPPAAGRPQQPQATAPAQAAPVAPAPQAAPAAAPAPAPAPAPGPAAPPAVPGAEVSRLRGAAARTVTNMTASLSVPTATSVRSVPAKLLVDNRIVINNHLKRGRGGKVSFTHLIGYAVVQALKALPEMNDAYTEEGGKPAIARPEHVNLGVAIDVHTADGARQLLVPNIKAAEEHGLPAVLDLLRGHRAPSARGQAHGRGLRWHHRHHHQPGHHRHRSLSTEADARPGLHRRRRRDGVPRRVRGRVGGDPGPAGHQQGGHAHLDLRPPDHPGRPVRRVPEEDPPSCCWAKTPSTTSSSPRCASRTSRSAGSGTSRTVTRTTWRGPRGCRN